MAGDTVSTSGGPAEQLDQPPSLVRLVDALAGFSRTLIQRPEVSATLADLTHHLVAALELDGAGASLMQGTHLHHVAADGDRARRLEESQERSGSGPGAEAARSVTVVAISDLRTERHRWPAFASEAEAVGVLAVAALPLHAEDGAIGTIDLYRQQPHVWTERELADTQILADLASSYVVHAGEVAAHQSTVVQLQRALESRVIVEQAKGVLANAYGIHPEQAFQLIRRHARSHRATLREVADAVVNLGLRP